MHLQQKWREIKTWTMKRSGNCFYNLWNLYKLINSFPVLTELCKWDELSILLEKPHFTIKIINSLNAMKNDLWNTFHYLS